MQLVAVGYGQVNAIQSVLVADQFDGKTQAREMALCFSWYYLWWNVGNLGGEICGPLLREYVSVTVCVIVIGATCAAGSATFAAGVRIVVSKPVDKHAATVTLQQIKQDLAALRPIIKVRSERDGAPTAEWPWAPPLTQPWCRRAAQIFGPLILFWAAFFQQNSTWIHQGNQMDRRLGTIRVPPDLMPSVNDLMLIAFIPLMDYIVYPRLGRLLGFRIRALHKMAMGLACAGISFLLAGGVQLLINRSDQESVSITLQLPQYVMISFSEVFIIVSGLEFAYSQTVPELRNMVTSLWYVSQALGQSVQVAVAQVPSRHHNMEVFFAYGAALCLQCGLFWCLNRRFRYLEDAVSVVREDDADDCLADDRATLLPDGDRRR